MFIAAIFVGSQIDDLFFACLFAFVLFMALRIFYFCFLKKLLVFYFEKMEGDGDTAGSLDFDQQDRGCREETDSLPQSSCSPPLPLPANQHAW